MRCRGLARRQDVADPPTDVGRGAAASEVGRHHTCVEGPPDRCLDGRRLLAPTEVVEKQGDAPDRAHGVRDAFPRYVRCRTVDWLEKSVATRVHIGGRREPDAPRDSRRQVAEDVPEKIRGHDHRVLVGAAHEIHGHCVHIHTVLPDVRIALTHLGEGAAPQRAGYGHGVRLVDHGHPIALI